MHISIVVRRSPWLLAACTRRRGPGMPGGGQPAATSGACNRRWGRGRGLMLQVGPRSDHWNVGWDPLVGYGYLAVTLLLQRYHSERTDLRLPLRPRSLNAESEAQKDHALLSTTASPHNLSSPGLLSRDAWWWHRSRQACNVHESRPT